MSDESQLAELPTLPTSSLRPEFRRDLENLKKKVQSTVRVKTIFGKEVTGGMLAELAIAYVAAINDNAAPTITTAWERVVERQCAVSVPRQSLWESLRLSAHWGCSRDCVARDPAAPSTVYGWLAGCGVEWIRPLWRRA